MAVGWQPDAEKAGIAGLLFILRTDGIGPSTLF